LDRLVVLWCTQRILSSAQLSTSRRELDSASNGCNEDNPCSPEAGKS